MAALAKLPPQKLHFPFELCLVIGISSDLIAAKI